MDITVVGAGIAGLTSAARLASQGHHVTIFEKSGKVGERMSQPKKDGLTFNLDPTIVMILDVYKAIFEECDKHFENYIDIHQLSHIFDIYFSDKNGISVSTGLPQLSQTLEAIKPDSIHGFISFLTDVYKRYGIARKYFLECILHEPGEFYNPITLYRDIKLRTLGKANHLIDSYAKNEKIHKLFVFQTLYVRIDSKQGPSIYSIIPMTEMMHGVYYIKGGAYSFDKGLRRLTQGLGVSIELDSGVQEIIVDLRFKRVDGLRVNGDTHRFDKVLCTADFPYATQHPMPSHSPLKKYTPAKIDKVDYSCSAFLIYAGINRDLKDKIHLHNVILAEDFRENIGDIFGGRLPKDPSIHLYFPSVEGEELTPERRTGMHILMPIPELKTDQIDWNNPAIIGQVKNEIYKEAETIESFKGLRNDIVSGTVFTPLDFKTHYSAKFGIASGLMPTLTQSNYCRPPNVSRDCEDLYLVGASTHPGTGIPIVLTSTKITAEAMLEDIKNMK